MYRHIEEFVRALDEYLKMEGKLVKNFDVLKHFGDYINSTEPLAFEKFYEVFVKWSLS